MSEHDDIPIVGQSSGPEQLELKPASELQCLREYRAASIQARALAMLSRELSSSSLLERDLSDAGGRAAETGLMTTDVTIDSAEDRMVLNAVGQALGMQKDGVLQRALGLATGAHEVYAVAPGLTFQLTRYGQQPSDLSYWLVADETVDLIQRKAGLESFSARTHAVFGVVRSAEAEIASSLKLGSATAYTTQAFNLASETDEIFTFLSDLGTGAGPQYSGLGGIRTLDDVRKEAIAQLAELRSHIGEADNGSGKERVGIYYSVDGIVEKIVLATPLAGVYVTMKATGQLTTNLAEASFLLGVELSPDHMNTERDYNGREHEGALPFIETPTASALLSSFEAAGLTPNARISDTLAEVGRLEKRYGHGYADLTREIAKLVNDPRRDPTAFFDACDDMQARIARLALTGEPAADAAILLLKGVIARDAQPDTAVPELQSSPSRIEMRDGSCKDIEVYLARASFSQAIELDASGEPLLLHSPYRRPVVMTLQPVVLGGVRLPAGALLAVESNGYAFMRLTGYTFAPEEAATVFGAQDAENRMYPEYASRHWDRLMRR